MKKTLLSVLAVAVLLGFSQFAAAQTAAKPSSAAESGKPMVTVAFSGYAELKADIGMIAELGGNANATEGIEMMITMMTQGEGLAAVDQKQPWGALVSAGAGTPHVLAFVPITDMDKFVSLLEKFGMQPQDQGDGVYTVQGPAATITLKKAGGFALIASDEEALKAAPSDPVKALGGLEKKYDVAVKISAANVPDEYKQMAIATIKMGSQAGARQMPGEDDDAYKARINLTNQSIQQITDLITETDEVLLGWTIDQKAKSAHLDIQIKATAGTKLAKQFATLVDAKTSFAGVTLPDAAITANWSRTMTDDEVTQAKSMLKNIRAGMVKDLDKQGLDEEKLDLAKQLITDLFGMIEKTVDGKKADGGMAVVLDPEAVKMVLAGKIADGAKLEKILKQLAPEIEKEVPDAKVKLNAETYKTVRLHVISAPLPQDEDAAKAAKFLGDPATLVVGVNDSAVYVAAGRDALETIKSVIDNSKTPKTIPPIAMSVAIAPIVKFVASVSEDNPQAQMVCQMISGMLEKAPGKDHVTITVTGIPNGELARVELEEGVLALIGGGSQMAGGMAPPPGGMPPATMEAPGGFDDPEPMPEDGGDTE